MKKTLADTEKIVGQYTANLDVETLRVRYMKYLENTFVQFFV